MSVRDFPPRPQGAEPDSVPYQNWLDSLGQRQNIDLQQELTSVASGDELLIFDVSETVNVKTKKATVSNIAAGAGAVIGPASSTDNAAVRFDSTTGKLAQNSALIIADTTGSLSRSGDGGIPIQGTNTNDNAATGYVGEYISSQVLFASGVTLTTNVAANVTSISVTAGDWDVSANLSLSNDGSATITDMLGAISTTSATFPSEASDPAFTIFTHPITTGAAALFPIGTKRISISSTTTVYFVARSAFTGGTVKASGFIGARRAR